MQVYFNGSLAELADQMSNQLVERGWSHDVSWTGATTVGSSWLRTTSDSIRLHGTLDITAISSTGYIVMFRTIER
jgi:hypothetical protein